MTVFPAALAVLAAALVTVPLTVPLEALLPARYVFNTSAASAPQDMAAGGS